MVLFMDNQLTAKIYQRIDNTGRWIETVTLAPQIIDRGNGTFEIGYIPSDDVIEVGAPIDPNSRWNGSVWEPIVEPIPERPLAIARWRIDDDNLYVIGGEVLIEPVLHENRWVYPGIDDPYLVEMPLPQDVPWYRPRWDGNRWIESLTAEQIAALNPPHPDWQGFFDAWVASSIDEKLIETNDQTAWAQLLLLLGRLPNVAIEQAVTTWNRCIAGLSNPLTDEDLTEIANLIQKNHLPLMVDAVGAISYQP